MTFVLCTQLVHCAEHAIQVIQIMTGTPAPEAKAVFGQIFNPEWFHFAFNTYLLAATAIFVSRSSRNPFLWAALVIGAAHEAEHVFLIGQYLALGRENLPGIIGSGGAARVLTQFTRPYVHFFYNFIETTPLVLGWLWEQHRVSRILSPWVRSVALWRMRSA